MYKTIHLMYTFLNESTKWYYSTYTNFQSLHPKYTFFKKCTILKE